MTSRATTNQEFQALAELRYQIRHFLNFSESAARAAGLEPQQHKLLLALKGLEPGRRPTVGALAERLQIQHNSAVELVKRSARRGLVRRRTSSTDGREALIHITPKGEAALRQLSLAHKEELRSRGKALVRALRALLARGRQRTV